MVEAVLDKSSMGRMRRGGHGCARRWSWRGCNKDVVEERQMRIKSNTKISDRGNRDGSSLVEDELSERRIEGSGIFLILVDRPIMMNSVLEGLRRRRSNDIH